ncbi:MAG: peptide transporter [Myxococcales bacterium]|nr:peptide transporter [Myxococcales bacterium]
MTGRLDRPGPFWAAAAALALVALWARLAGIGNVLTAGGVFLKPTDSHYYVRFALLQLTSFPGFASFDAYVNFPEGARIYWPPLHTWLVTAAVWLSGSRGPEAGAAFVGPLVAMAELLLVGVLARRTYGGATALVAMLGLALIPVSIESSALGNADHHVHEPFLAAALAVLLARAVGGGLCKAASGELPAAAGGELRAAVLAGLLLGASRLLTTLTVALIPCAAAGLALAAVVARERRGNISRAAVWCGTSAALSLWLGAALFGRLASLEYVELSSFPPVLAIGCFGLVAALTPSPLPRAGEGLTRCLRPWALAPTAVAIAAMGWQALRASSHLLGGDPLMALAAESQPLFRYLDWTVDLLGVSLLLLPLAVAGAARALKRAPALAPPLAFSVLLAALAFLAQARFTQALAGAVSVLAPLALPKLFEGASPRVARLAFGLAVLAALSFAPALTPIPPPAEPGHEALVRSTMRWLREHTPPPGEPPSYAVVAHHDMGHLLTLWAERPAVATPFSQAPWHLAGNARASAVMAACDDDEAYQLAKATGARYVLANPFYGILGRPEAEDERTLARRLLDQGGMATSRSVATAHFRLVHDSPEQRLRGKQGSWARVFEVVPGATLHGRATPSAEVVARLQLVTNLGRSLEYERRGLASPSGDFELLVAYPSYGQAEVRAGGPYLLESAGKSVRVQVLEQAAATGERIRVVGLE